MQRAQVAVGVRTRTRRASCCRQPACSPRALRLGIHCASRLRLGRARSCASTCMTPSLPIRAGELGMHRSACTARQLQLPLGSPKHVWQVLVAVDAAGRPNPRWEVRRPLPLRWRHTSAWHCCTSRLGMASAPRHTRTQASPQHIRPRQVHWTDPACSDESTAAFYEAFTRGHAHLPARPHACTQVQKAYSILGDWQKRRKYEREEHEAVDRPETPRHANPCAHMLPRRLGCTSVGRHGWWHGLCRKPHFGFAGSRTC